MPVRRAEGLRERAKTTRENRTAPKQKHKKGGSFPRLEAVSFDPETVDYVIARATEEFQERLTSWEALERKTATLLGFASGVLLLTLNFAPDAVARAGVASAHWAQWCACRAEVSLMVSIAFMGLALWPMTFPAPQPCAAIDQQRLRRKVEVYKAEYAWGFKTAGAKLRFVACLKSWSLRLALVFMALALLSLLALGMAGLNGGV